MEKCLYAYAWDFVGEGVDSVLGRIADLGLDAVAMAVSYHAGKFILPHNPLAKVYFPEDGTVYFLPDSGYYPGSLKPAPAAVLDGIDVLEILSHKCEEYGLKLHAWTVCMHNTRIGILHPDLTVKNVYGDRYPYSLCPAQPEVAGYITGLISNLTHKYSLDTVFLESLGYMGFSHNYHHEFFGVNLDHCSQALLSLCFCEKCIAKAQNAGIDTDRLKQICRKYIDDSIEGMPNENSLSFEQLLAEHSELRQYIKMRCGVVSDLVRQVRKIADQQHTRLDYFGPVFQPSIKDAQIEGLDISDIASVVDHYVIPVGSPDIEQIDSDINYAKSLANPDRIKLSINLGVAATPTEQCFRDKLELIHRHGLAGCNIYNYSTLPQTRLDWIKKA